MSEVEIIEYRGVKIGLLAIAADVRATRRAQETAAVRQIVDVLLGKDTVISHSADGAPLAEGWNISVTHSRRLAAVAISKDKSIGIDAEEWRDALTKTQRLYVAESEKKWAQDEHLLSLWTIKEAVYKAAQTSKLAFTAIEAANNLQSALAAGRRYEIKAFARGETHISLAISQ